jgi:hypothetical protein
MGHLLQPLVADVVDVGVYGIPWSVAPLTPMKKACAALWMV